MGGFSIPIIVPYRVFPIEGTTVRTPPKPTFEEKKANETMFSISPYYAKRPVFTTQPDKSMKKTMEPCRVIGVDKDEDGELAYIVEFTANGATFLERETYIVKCEPGNPI